MKAYIKKISFDITITTIDVIIYKSRFRMNYNCFFKRYYTISLIGIYDHEIIIKKYKLLNQHMLNWQKIIND